MIQTIEMTDIGNGRPSNQDAYLIKKGKHEGKQCLLAAVCDGMGGLRRGEIASRYIIELLKQWFDEVLPGLIRKKKIDRIQKDLIGLIKKSNDNLLLMSEDTDETMGSTLTLLFVLGEQFFVLNVGDSRAYWFEQGRKYVTTDHTLAQLEVKAGHMTREQARRDPRRHILIQCVGVTKDIKIDCYRGRIEPGWNFCFVQMVFTAVWRKRKFTMWIRIKMRCGCGLKIVFEKSKKEVSLIIFHVF